MATRMLVDATHAEETRVVVVDGNRLQEFDYETSTKKQLKGNIYLAKVTRVEPSLQAAFVDYGGNRDGFLPFNEIHPDYYQIPIADRQALLERDEAESAADDGAGGNGRSADGDAPAEDLAEDAGDAVEAAALDAEENGDEAVDDIGGDELEEVRKARRRAYRPYKIQEVIKRRQILLVQVAKEERGNKGAALTTYLSLAGRYCVLMPNTGRGGGVSRKIVNATDRKRLKDIIGSLEVPQGMGVIVRTAGMNRNKLEIKRDFDYLLRLWDEIRETTLESTAPTLVYEEANLIKRCIRDLYSKDIEEILVDGDEGYRTAKSFMRMIVPSRAKVVQPYRDRIPMFHRYKVEEQFDAMHSPVVHLKSGGYIVINPTEALVSIDVNSGKATKERTIEETALKTNLEAAEELARQIRLRDLSGLIVVDFIDMEVAKNNRAVERRLKEALKSDRARLQVGRISTFGLLEMSRQRLRPSLIEASTDPCPHCAGTGVVRSTESSTLHVLRAIEEEGLRKPGGELMAHVATPVALYLLNYKRQALATIEERYRFTVFVLGDDDMVPPEVRIERQKGHEVAAPRAARVAPEAEAEAAPEREARAAEDEGEIEEGGRKRRRRPRRRRRGRDEREVGAEREAGVEAAPAEAGAERGAEAEQPDDSGAAAAEAGAEEEAEAPRKRRRRGKRGGGRRRAAREKAAAGTADAGHEADSEAAAEAAPETELTAAAPEEAETRESWLESDDEAAPEAEVAAETEPAAPWQPAGGDGEDEEQPAAEAEPTLPAAEVVAETAPPQPWEPAGGDGQEAEQPVAETEPAAPIADEPAPEHATPETPFATVPQEEAAEQVPTSIGEQAEEVAKSSTRRGWWRRPSI